MLKEQIAQALNRGDSKLADELVPLFKMQQARQFEIDKETTSSRVLGVI